jgi:hypothetical protein
MACRLYRKAKVGSLLPSCIVLDRLLAFYFSLRVIVFPSNALPDSLENLIAASISFCFVEIGSTP